MKFFGLVMVCLLCLSCSSEAPEPLQTISLTRALEPDSDCNFSWMNNSWEAGWYDPKAASAMRVYLESTANGLEDGDAVELNTVRVCYSDATRTVDPSSDHKECDAYFDSGVEFPGFYGEALEVSGRIESCIGDGCDLTEVIELEVLTEPMLQEIYSASYSSSTISVWFSDAPMGEAGCCRYFYTDLFLLMEEDRICCSDALWEMGVATGPETGSPWGEFSPRPKSDLKIEFQLVGESPRGKTLTSAWLSLPTTLCPGCTSAHGETTGCEVMTGEFCDYGVCEVGGAVEACTANGCSQADTPCTNFRYALSGETPDVQGCIVSQMQGITQRCKDVVGCE